LTCQRDVRAPEAEPDGQRLMPHLDRRGRTHFLFRVLASPGTVTGEGGALNP